MKTATNNSSSSSNGVMTRWAWHKKLPEGQTPKRRSNEADQKVLLNKQKMPKGQTPTGRNQAENLDDTTHMVEGNDSIVGRPPEGTIWEAGGRRH